MAGVEHEARIGRVESEVQTIRSEMGSLTSEVSGLKADVKGLGSILGRIEQGVLRAQEKSEEREVRGKPNLIAVVSVLITVIFTLVGGAWVIGGQLARTEERTQWIMQQLNRDEQRLWDGRGRGAANAVSNQAQ